MKRIGLTVLSLSFLTIGAHAAPPQEVIDQCMKASDFEGCVKVMTGQTDAGQETKITVDLDKIRSTGNMCPSTHAYTGAGYCQEVKCFRNPSGHESRLGGKGWSCKGGLTMQFVGQPIRATTDERCPLEEPDIGKSNSCVNGLSEQEIESGIRIFTIKANKAIRYGFYDSLSKDPKGILIDKVDDGCAADLAGLQKGDIVLSVNDFTYFSRKDSKDKFFSDMVSKRKELKFQIVRNGNKKTIIIEPSMCSNPQLKFRGNPKTMNRTFL